MATTKAQLESANAELAASNAELLEKIQQLTALLEAPAEEPQRDELQQRLWIDEASVVRDHTKSGKRRLTFRAQKSSLDKQSGRRVYGANRSFVALGDLATTVHELLLTGDRLFDLTAWESPWLNGSRRSDWMLTSIHPVERKPEPEAEADAEPADPWNADDVEAELPY